MPGTPDPIAPDSFERLTHARNARRREFFAPLLATVVLIALIGSVSAYGLGLIGTGRLALDLAITATIGVLPYVLLRLGHVTVSLALCLGATFVALTWLAWSGGGLTAHLATYQLLYVILGSFLVGRRWAYILAAGVALVDAGIVYAEANGLLPPSQVDLKPIYTLLVLSMASLFSVTLITRFVGNLESAVHRTRTELANREATEGELARSHREYRHLVALVPGVVFKFRVNTDGSYAIPFVSDAVERLTGLPASEVMADASRAFAAAVPEAEPELLASIQLAVRDRGPWQAEFPIRAHDGSVKWVRAQAVPTGVDDQDRAVWHGMLLDITDRRVAEEEQQASRERLRQSERRFRSLAESIPEVFWVIDVPGHFVYVSPAVASVWGISPEEVLRDPDLWLRAVHPADRRRLMTRFTAWLRSPEREMHEDEFRLIRPDGELRILESRVTLRERNAEGGWRVGGVVADVTERRRAEEEARTAERQTLQRQKLEALGTLAGGIAHDFNNLLGVITGYAELARLEAPKMAELMDPLLGAGQRAKDLVRRILLFSRPSGGERRAVKVAQVVDEVVGLLRATLPKSVEIEWTQGPDDPVVLADPAQLSQALMNLGVNAGHALPESGGRIVLTMKCMTVDAHAATRLQLDRGPYVTLTVTDTGCGMPQEVLGRVFEPFFTTRPSGQGTGLGLAVVQSIVQNHGGCVTAESALGSGSTFTVWMPAELTAAPALKHRRPRTEPFGGGRRIMIVEDQTEVLSVTRAMVERLGFAVAPFSDPIAAASSFVDAPDMFDAVLSDRSMPTMSGLELGKAVAEARPETPFILMTGFEGGIRRELLADSGIGEVLAKPVRLSDLAQCLRHHLGPTGSPAPEPVGPATPEA